MALESAPRMKKWPIALAVIACIPGWIAWMDLLGFSASSPKVPLLKFATPSAWEYALLIGGPLVAIALIGWGMSFSLKRTVAAVVGLYVAALWIASLLAFVDKAPEWMVVVILAAGFLFVGIIAATSAGERREVTLEESEAAPSDLYVADELAKLAALRESNVLSEEEFTARKAKLLG